ncbi:RodZ domain-containing protein [Exilibacterium tricleocarpae]|nr:RodZ domain-containing protein [Exilibacterium tricleocarpae]
MSADDTSTTSPPPATDHTPGARLRAAREAANLTPQSVAAELRIPEDKLCALEQDHYEYMVSETFVRGYIRRYAGLVNLDGDELVACYDHYLAEMRRTTERVTQADLGTGRQAAARRLPSWMMPAAIASALMLVWVLAVNLFEEPQSPGPMAAPGTGVAGESPAPSGPASIDSDGLQDQPAPAGELASMAPATAEPAPAAPVSAEPAADASGPADLVAPAPQVAAVSDSLELSFTDECWVEVTDAGGKVLIADLQRAGQTVSLSGAAPFNIMLGNARAVAVTLNGAAVAVNPQSGRKTLRFIVGE